MFIQKKSVVMQGILLILLSLILIFIDYRTHYLRPVRQWLTVAATPIYWLADLPVKIADIAQETVLSHSTLFEENAKLTAKNLLLQQQVQKLASLTVQNIRLKELLNSADLVNEQVAVAEVIGIDPNPFSHIVLISKGGLDGVFLGQAIVDSNGVMGQVVEVSPVSSRVRLVTDNASRVPVQNNRTGYRAIAAGIGDKGELELLHIPVTVDFKVGDL